MFRLLTGVVLGIGLAALPLGASSFLQVTPPLVELSLEPGRKMSGRLTIQNNQSRPIPVTIEVQDGWVYQIGRPSVIPPSEWLSLKVPKSLVLPANGSKSVPYKIRVPPQFSGEVMALIFFSGPPEQGPNAAMGIQLRHGIPIYLSAKGTERATLTVAEVQAYAPGNGSLEFVLTLLSDGNTHVRPRGEVAITDVFGGAVDRFDVEYGAPVFPESRQKYYARSGRTGWAPGRYRALLNVTYGEAWGPRKTLEALFSMEIKNNQVALKEIPRVP